MTILVLGGGLRAATACYLAKQAGHRVILCDKKPGGPASGLCDEFIPFAPNALPTADWILPAGADSALLSAARGEKLLFDPEAQAVCTSKLTGDDLLAAHGFARPRRFPQGSEPYIVKPDRDSFGRGIWATEDFCEVGGAVNANFLSQEELNGPVVSVTVLGAPGAYAAGPVLALEPDDRYDLCRASLPAPIPAEAQAAFSAEALRLAELLGVEGLLEVQAVYHGGLCKIIEMNGHFPELSALCLLAGGTNLVTQLIARAEGERPVFAEIAAPVGAVCRKDGQPAGRRDAGDEGPMQPLSDGIGFAGARYRLCGET